MQTPSENNYIYYVIEDSDKKIRGHLIGVQHWVEPKDKNLNSTILDAIDRSARTVLEMPPKSDLLPSEPDSFNYVINKVVTHLKLSPKSTKSDISLEEEVQSQLKTIKERTSEEGYGKVVTMLMSLPTKEEQLKFIEAIQKNLFEFNQVSLEENINKKVEALKKVWEPLEKINLKEEIVKAEQKIKARKEKEEYKGLEKEKDTSHIDKEAEVAKEAHEEALYKAWVTGDAQKLRELLDKGFELNEEPPEIDEVHASRDKEMAKRIIEVVNVAKKEDSEATIIMGCAHLLYTKRKNILAYLTESSDLSGWSIRQIKKT
ncbi:MAG: TraB/GumN family protein [Parachlamydiaceae bacterium]|nr:TraB/GumN family protein [Parachlamydiaceae bacterium]